MVHKESKKVKKAIGSLLFMDISGFTRLTELLSKFGKEGTEELSSILNNFFEVMIKLIKEYNGKILKFGGDALLVGFYYDKDKSEQIAASCALQLIKQSKKFGGIYLF